VRPYYQDNAVTIYHGDCREILPQLAPVDLVLTDPPYGVNLGNHKGASDDGGTHGYLGKGSYLSYEDTPENLKAIVIPAIRSALDIAKRTIVFVAGIHVNEFPKPAAIGGIYFPSAIGRHCWGFNSLAIALLYGHAPTNKIGSLPTVIVSCDGPENNGHPCAKPIRAIKGFVRLGSLLGETILDPFMGSGTTLRAAKDLGRKAIGIEIEEKYCEIAAQRMSQEVLHLGVA
jgi:site-specific DNA-methyltransferase (adenine-specific)